MTAVAIAVAEDNVARWTVNCQAVIPVVDHVVLEQYIRALCGETYQTDLISGIILLTIEWTCRR